MTTKATRQTRPIKTKLGPWVKRQLPPLDPEVVPFWEGLRKHEFLLCRCKRCGSCYFPYTVCVMHPDIPDFSEVEWAPSSGRGKVFARLIVHQVSDSAYAEDIPYALVIVELDEGPLFPTRIVDSDPEQVKIGMPVEVAYYDVPEAGHTLPLFRPVG